MSNRSAAAVFLLISILVIGTLSVFTVFLEGIELQTYDFLTFLRGERGPNPEILIVAIDQPSIDEIAHLGLGFPWPRAIYGELVRLLNDAGAKAVVFDVVFDLELDPDSDAAFAEAIAQSSIPVVLAATIETVMDSRFTLEKEVYPAQPFLDAGAKVGFARLNQDRDGVLRHARLTVRGEPSLSLGALAAVGQMVPLNEIPAVAQEGEDPEILINYVGGPRTFPTVSFYQALDYENSLPAEVFDGKIVLVGRSQSVHEVSQTASLVDSFSTPFAVGLAAPMPGVEIHANVLSTLMDRTFMGQIPPGMVLAAALVLGIVVSILVVSLNSLKAKLFSSLGVLFGFLVLSILSFFAFDYWVWIVQPLAIGGLSLSLNTVHQYRKVEKERAYIRGALKGYVSSQVLDEVLKDPKKLELGGVQVEATVLFSDIAGFSKLSESITPRELALLLNEYFSKVGDAIMHRNGMINKYIGDAVMALWGVPIFRPDHAIQACKAALDMRRIIAEFPNLKTRIGLNTGQMVAGNLGHRERMEYTVIGDAVNLASRLEGANKAFGSTIMISDTTEKMLDNQFWVRPLDKIRVVGKKMPVQVFELIAQKSDPLPDEMMRKLESHARILDAYERRSWEEACQEVERHLQEFPDDLVISKVYKERCLTFREQPPPDDWDGVFELKSK